jgi:flagellar biosynthesis GTPase FlhF
MENYTRMKKLGEGGFGLVFLVKDRRDGQLYVMKEVDLGKLDAKARADSVKEADFLKKLKHPNIIGYHEYFQATTSQPTRFGNVNSQKLYIIMHFADGGDLESRIKARRGQLFSESEILDWFVQMTLALKHIHDRKILHRDIKSQNVFLTSKQSIVKLGDFGIAKSLAHTHAQARTMIGTPYYLSPEICREAPYNSKSDIWALGVVLYELMCLRHPFQGASMKELLQRICTAQPAPPSATYSRDLRALLARLLDKNPEQRPSVNGILQLPIVRGRIARFLSAHVLQEEFSHTVIHAAGSLKQHAALGYLQNQQNQQQQDAAEANPNGNAGAGAGAGIGAGGQLPPPVHPSAAAAFAPALGGTPLQQHPPAVAANQAAQSAAAAAAAARAAEASRLAERQLALLQQRRAQMQAQADARAKADAEGRARALAALRAKEDKAREAERARAEKEKERERERLLRAQREAQRRADAARAQEAEAEARRAAIRQSREEFIRNKERAAAANRGGGGGSGSGGDVDVMIYEGKRPAVRPIIPDAPHADDDGRGPGRDKGGGGDSSGGCGWGAAPPPRRRPAPAAAPVADERPPWRGATDDDSSYEEKLRLARLEYARDKEIARRRRLGLPLDDEPAAPAAAPTSAPAATAAADMNYTYSPAAGPGLAHVPSYARQGSGGGYGGYGSGRGSSGGSSAPYGTDPSADGPAPSRAAANAAYEADHARLRAEYEAERRAIAAKRGAGGGAGAGAGPAAANAAPYHTDSRADATGAVAGAGGAPLSRRDEQRAYEAELQRLRESYQSERASVEQKLRGIVGGQPAVPVQPPAQASAQAQGPRGAVHGYDGNDDAGGYGGGYGGGHDGYSNPAAHYGANYGPGAGAVAARGGGGGSGSSGYGAYGAPARAGFGVGAGAAAPGRPKSREEELEAARLAVLEERRALQQKAARYLAEAGDGVVLPGQAAAPGQSPVPAGGAAAGTATAGAELSEARAAFLEYKAAKEAATAAATATAASAAGPAQVGSGDSDGKAAYLARLASRGVAGVGALRLDGGGDAGSPAPGGVGGDGDAFGSDWDAVLPPSPYTARSAAAAAAGAGVGADDSSMPAGVGGEGSSGISGSGDDLTAEQALGALARDADEFLLLCNNMRAALEGGDEGDAGDNDVDAGDAPASPDDEDDAVVRDMVSRAAPAAAAPSAPAAAGRGAVPEFIPVSNRARNASDVTAEALQQAYYVNHQFRDSATNRVIATVEAEGFILDVKGNIVGFLTGARDGASAAPAAVAQKAVASSASTVAEPEAGAVVPLDEDEEDVVAVHLLSSFPASAVGVGRVGGAAAGSVPSGTVRVYAPFAVGAKIESMDEEDIADVLDN